MLRAAGRIAEATPPLAAPGLDGVVELIDAILTPQTLEWPVLTPAGQDPALPFRDTLSAIAKHYLGSANRYREIFEANKPMLSDPDKIYPGQTLRIPQA